MNSPRWLYKPSQSDQHCRFEGPLLIHRALLLTLSRTSQGKELYRPTFVTQLLATINNIWDRLLDAPLICQRKVCMYSILRPYPAPADLSFEISFLSTCFHSLLSHSMEVLFRPLSPFAAGGHLADSGF